jgi:hypothetical protein
MTMQPLSKKQRLAPMSVLPNTVPVIFPLLEKYLIWLYSPKLLTFLLPASNAGMKKTSVITTLVFLAKDC